MSGFIQHDNPMFLFSLRERFYEKVLFLTYDRGCWIWIGAYTRDGYGRIGLGGRAGRGVASHIASWIIHKGDVPEGMWVLHNCDNRGCCNPNHLCLGTRLDNARHAVERGRMAVGERQAASKLKNHQIPEIRSLCDSGVSQREVAKLFSCHQVTVSKIYQRKAWRHIPELK